MIERCLKEGEQPYWMCDQGNAASRQLAERLGFVYQGDIWLAEVPLDPFAFYRGLAIGFHIPNGQHRRAGQAYERAFRGRAGDAADDYAAAVAWAMADEPDRAFHWLKQAIVRGWRDVSALESEEAFRILRTMPAWRTVVVCALRQTE